LSIWSSDGLASSVVQSSLSGWASTLVYAVVRFCFGLVFLLLLFFVFLFVFVLFCNRFLGMVEAGHCGTSGGRQVEGFVGYSHVLGAWKGNGV